MLAASLAPWLARRGIHYGWVMVVLFGWALASHQLAAGLATLATGISRDIFASYFAAFFTAGLVCLLASVTIFSLRPNRPAAPAVA